MIIDIDIPIWSIFLVGLIYVGTVTVLATVAGAVTGYLVRGTTASDGVAHGLWIGGTGTGVHLTGCRKRVL